MSKDKKRNWKGYFIEFIMLFLAVSFGFLADNYREKASERTKEREYIQSMIEDVNEDQLNVKEVIEKNSQRSIYLDSCINSCFNYDSTNSGKMELHTYFKNVLFHPEFITPAELTMQQLKNAGGMRLIKSKKAINEIIRYDSKAKKIATQQIYYENYQNKAIDIGTKIFNIQKILYGIINKTSDYQSTNFDLINEDESKLKELGNSVVMYKGIIDYYILLLEEMHQQGEVLIQILNREYDLK